MVEPSVSRWYAHRARVVGSVAAAVSGVVGAVVASQLVSSTSTVARVALALVLGAMVAAVFGVTTAVVVRVWPVLRAVWWWSLELAAVGLLLTAWWLLDTYVSAWLAAGVLATTAVACVVLRRVRRWLTAWGWCVIVRHRLRVTFAEVIRAASKGKARPITLPFILLARPTPAGERVWVWLRPGLDLADLDGGTGRMAVACWAGEVRVCRASTRYAALVRVDIARRDPLQRLVSSPLAREFAGVGIWPAESAAGVPVSGLDLDDVPEPAVDPRGRR
ncbi:hypothetical protein Rhe02_14620 [Rhizocola hellebori]|uniref:Uncharacterized protein n=1 Tax=Rhizocola hellebori TaxID=1392758 RepID=A0A8J3Q545_9ACTN|nr:hypothetical protein Rhe02_14620 [Rhizocola hellebori]